MSVQEHRTQLSVQARSQADSSRLGAGPVHVAMATAQQPWHQQPINTVRASTAAVPRPETHCTPPLQLHCTCAPHSTFAL